MCVIVVLREVFDGAYDTIPRFASAALGNSVEIRASWKHGSPD